MKLRFIWLAVIFLLTWMSKQCSRKWLSSLPSLGEGSFRNQLCFCCVFQDKSRVRGTRASFCGWLEHNRKERWPFSTVPNVLILYPLAITLTIRQHQMQIFLFFTMPWPSEDQHNQTIGQLNRGYSDFAVACHFHVSKKTVRNLQMRWQATRTTQDRPRSGRP